MPPRPSVRLRALAAALLLACIALLPACGDDPAAPELEADTLFGFVTDADDLDRLEALVRQVELGTLLQTGSDLTLFAPTDLALERLGPDMLYRIAGNPDVLLKILRRHLVPGRFRVEDLRDGDTLTPLAGPPLTVRIVDDRVYVGEARLTLRRTDFETGNGLVHFLDDVVRDHLTLAERLRVTPLATDFARAFAQAGLDELLGGGEPYTLLIPIDNAFDVFGGDRLQELLRFANRDVLLKVMRHHVLPGRVRLEDLAGTDALTPLDGSPLSVTNEGGVHYLGGARVIVAEVEASDGLIYLLDRIVANHLDLTEHLRITPGRTLFLQILNEAGLLDELRGEQQLTVFAPSDETLEVLGPPFIDALRQRPDLLLRTAQYGIVTGRVEWPTLLQGGTLETLGGYELPITVLNDAGTRTVLLANRARVDPSPRSARNGLLYSIAPFLIPPDMNLEERAVFARLYRFLALMQEAGLNHLLHEAGPYTIFGPTDGALADQPPSELQETLKYHFVPGYYTYDELIALAADTTQGPATLPTLHGAELALAFNPFTGLSINNVAPITPNNQATNGIIHTLNGVLVPPE